MNGLLERDRGWEMGTACCTSTRKFNSQRLSLSFFAVVSDGIHQRLVIHDEEDRRVLRGVFMAMVLPQRHHKRIALLPFKALVADVADTAAAPDVINIRAGV